MSLLQIVTVSTRQGRKGPAIAAWFEAAAREHGQFDLEMIDLAEVNLPLLNEPEHPRLKQYQFDATKAWSETVARADAYVFVTPEYNFSTPPPLANALDYLFHEWSYKPVGFVSYGGISAGLRGVQMTKQIVSTLKMVPMVEAVAIPMFATMIDPSSGTFQPTAQHGRSAAVMLTELKRWTEALKPLRHDSHQS